MQQHTPEYRSGLVYGLAAYLTWGMVPLYFKALSALSPVHILGHRVLWSMLFLIPLVSWRGLWGEVGRAFRSGRMLMGLACSTLTLSINWFTFVYAVGANRVLETSLGYYINPLVAVALGVVVLKERLRPWQIVSVSLGVAAVVALTIAQGTLPVISLVLAFSFGSYGYIRKIVKVEPIVGLFVEATFLLPVGLGVIWWYERSGAWMHGTALHVSGHYLLLAASGVITALPLVWFAHAARKLPLATLGLLQYLTPTGSFLLAVLLFGEKMTGPRMIAFPMIWAALLIFSADTIRAVRRHEPVEIPATDILE